MRWGRRIINNTGSHNAPSSSVTLYFFMTSPGDFFGFEPPSAAFGCGCPLPSLHLCHRSWPTACQTFLAGPHPHNTPNTTKRTIPKKLNICALVCTADWCLGKPAGRRARCPALARTRAALDRLTPSQHTHNTFGPDHKTTKGAIFPGHRSFHFLPVPPLRSFLPLGAGAAALFSWPLGPLFIWG